MYNFSYCSLIRLFTESKNISIASPVTFIEGTHVGDSITVSKKNKPVSTFEKHGIKDKSPYPSISIGEWMNMLKSVMENYCADK